ncbi:MULTISPECIES: hypothetical protein [Actinosynnema]|uniref:hypothetical protein n=1 Tax=Actinosynnema TaxID=40566 RepID=UPI0020A4F89A|nr:hypothetical protein [Actinosynnema pretiosum]
MGWEEGPFGPGAERRVTRAFERVVLVVVPHVAAGTRLFDVVPLLEGDPRIQVVLAVQGRVTGTEAFARATGARVLPWDEATARRFDLVLAASPRGLQDLHGPVLRMPHGVGALKSRLTPRCGNAGPTHGLVREQLLHNGRPLASALVLAHDSELEVLRSSCPEAEPTALVAGDPCLDRVLVSSRRRQAYREALGVRDGQRLVVVSSTWTTRSVLGAHLDLYRELVGRGERVLAVVHPNATSVHGVRQVRAWLPPEVGLVPAAEGWRAAVIAADVCVGDHGSTTQYAAAAGRPVLLVPFPEDLVRPGSPAAVLRERAGVLDPALPLDPQLARARPVRGFARVVSSRPGGSAALLRSAAYRLLDLEEPPWPAVQEPVPLLHLVETGAARRGPAPRPEPGPLVRG